MLSRKTFIEAIGNIKKHEELIERLHEITKEFGDFPPNLDFENLNRKALLSVLKESMNDKFDYIEWWLYEATDDFTVSWEEDGRHEERCLKEVDALYDFLVEQTKTVSFDDLPIHDKDTAPDASEELAPCKVILKEDFLTYFDRVLEYVEANEIVLEIHGEGNEKLALMSIQLYDKMMGRIEVLEKKIRGIEKDAGAEDDNNKKTEQEAH